MNTRKDAAVASEPDISMSTEIAARTISMADFSPRFRFSEWRNNDVPPITAGCYVIWEGARLIYCGMSGQGFDLDKAARKSKYGLCTRLASHASGRLSGDQFCVYVANRLVLPTLRPSDLPKFESGELRLDQLVREYIQARLEYQYTCVLSGGEARALEDRCRRGEVFGAKPYLNPL
jgi:hypothetical protein